MSASSRLLLTSPASSCPFDVLGTIFLHLRDSESSLELYLEDITEVCRSWRIAALINRRLWSRILVDLQGFPSFEDYEMHKSRVQLYLQRSLAVPLSVEMTLNTNAWPPRKSFHGSASEPYYIHLSGDITLGESFN